MLFIRQNQLKDRIRTRSGGDGGAMAVISIRTIRATGPVCVGTGKVITFYTLSRAKPSTYAIYNDMQT